ncbi:RagB/SusD family nutrient uptake outer membrane protein [uncultured Mucilaginibacter sp.]|uniref:RagB/SusD family nutrient uptake outer membrane protein n=1 Tax=uncultured Mucilaginibacter sp. TaxID=797541 RepID=UPI0025E36776|nr:RagB/SusD family nutrient uptake outer membrane protein [uncultured Mucilaginibacter sp.]
MSKASLAIIACLLIMVSACRKYVEIPPSQVRALKYTTDYSALLNYGSTIEPGYTYPVYAADDFGVDDPTWYPRFSYQPPVNAYTWAERIWGPTEEDADWSTLYKVMNTYNTVITGVDKSEGGTDAQKAVIKASALVHRAYAYFTLVNLYGKQYDAATANSDLGVPLLLTPDLYASLSRATVQRVYDQVKSDLTEALPLLPEVATFNVNPSKLAVYSLLARYYLNTREFGEAKRYAEMALALRNTLLDYNAYTTTWPLKLQNPEEMFFKRTAQTVTVVPLQQAALNLYDTKDLRYSVFTAPAALVRGSNFTVGRGLTRSQYFLEGTYIGPGVPEMMLIKAECEARAGNTSAAMEMVNNLRKKRFKPAEYYNLAATDANNALRIVIDERGREFMGRGYRWFDQRRLSKDNGLIQTVTRKFKDATYTLAPGSNRYTFPIAEKYIALNPEIIQNPR